MGFEWDDKKATSNLKKHGVSFSEAATVFSDDNAMEMLDMDHSNEYEDRWILLGVSSRSNILIVVFLEKTDEEIRIISARKATKNESEQYFRMR